VAASRSTSSTSSWALEVALHNGCTLKSPRDHEFENRVIRGPNRTGSFTTGRAEREGRRVPGVSRPGSEGWVPL
jgi:hypothetical protein